MSESKAMRVAREVERQLELDPSKRRREMIARIVEAEFIGGAAADRDETAKCQCGSPRYAHHLNLQTRQYEYSLTGSGCERFRL